jgi:hypothetical protein
MSRFHFVISSSVFAVQDVISKKAVKKRLTKYQSLARQGVSGNVLDPSSYLSMQAGLSSIHPSTLPVFMLRSTSVHIRGQA